MSGDDEDKHILTIDQLPKHDNRYRDVVYDENSHPSFRDQLEASIHRHMHKVNEAYQDTARYRWLRDNVFDVLCEGRPADCIAKWMLPRLVAEDSTGRKYTFDEIIDIQMKRGQPNE